MATYYVSRYGDDTNNGLGPDVTHATNKPFRTVTKAFGSSGIKSGDTLMISPGTHERVPYYAINIGTITQETFITGDVANISGFTSPDGQRLQGGPVILVWGSPIELQGQNFLTYTDLWLEPSSQWGLISLQATSTNLTFRRCVMSLPMGGNFGNWFSGGFTVNQPANWLFDSCIFWHYAGGIPALRFDLPSSNVADYDLNIVIQNSIIVGSSDAVLVTSTGSNTYRGGGIVFRNVSFLAQGRYSLIATTTTSMTYPTVIRNCLMNTGIAGHSSAVNAISENYNLIVAYTARTNVNTGAQSRGVGPAGSAVIGFNFFSTMHGMRSGALGELRDYSDALSFGSDGLHPSTDLLGRPRPCGAMTFGYSGSVTSANSTTITDTTASWSSIFGNPGSFQWCIKITSGTGAGQVKAIRKPILPTVLTAHGKWITTPDSTSKYIIYKGHTATSGKATSGNSTSLTDSGCVWEFNWVGATLAIVAGTGAGQSVAIESSNGTSVTFSALQVALDNTSEYKIYRGTDENTVAPAAGALERGNTMVPQNAVVRGGTTALRAMGPAVQDFDVAVDPKSTTVRVYVQWDSNYSGTKPQLHIINGEECGVNATSVTATGVSNTWELLSLTVTPARKGIITVRLQSNTPTTTGMAYWDDLETTPVDVRGLDHTRRGEPLAWLNAPSTGVHRGRLVNQ